MNLHEKINHIQSQLKAPKNQFNKFGNYKYRSLEDILEAAKPMLLEQQLSILFSDELVMIGDRYYVKATVTLDDGSKTLKNTAYAREPLAQKGMNESQITGSASSYARKYAMNGLFAIDDCKDADSQSKNGNGSKPKEKQNEIVELAFLEFEAKHQAILTEEAFLHFEFNKKAFETAIVKHFKKLPTNKASIKKILTTIKPEEVLTEAA